MRAFIFLTTFVAAELQLIVSFRKLKGYRKLLPFGISLLLTVGMRYLVIPNASYGPGLVPFPAGTGLYLLLAMCTVGLAAGLVFWLCWYATFRRFGLSHKQRMIAYFTFLTIHLIITIYLSMPQTDLTFLTLLFEVIEIW